MDNELINFLKNKCKVSNDDINEYKDNNGQINYAYLCKHVIRRYNNSMQTTHENIEIEKYYNKYTTKTNDIEYARMHKSIHKFERRIDNIIKIAEKMRLNLEYDGNESDDEY